MSREVKNKVSKDKIINAAIIEFSENDYFKASTNSICKNNNISKGLLFHYFKSKDEIFLECIKKAVDELVEYINLNYENKSNSLKENINKYFDVRGEFFNLNPNYQSLFKSIMINPPKHLVNEINELNGKLKDLNKSILVQLLDSVQLRDGVSKESIIQLIFAFTDYLLVNKHDINEKKCNKELIDFIDILFYGAIKREEDKL